MLWDYGDGTCHSRISRRRRLLLSWLGMRRRKVGSQWAGDLPLNTASLFNYVAHPGLGYTCFPNARIKGVLHAQQAHPLRVPPVPSGSQPMTNALTHGPPGHLRIKLSARVWYSDWVLSCYLWRLKNKKKIPSPQNYSGQETSWQQLLSQLVFLLWCEPSCYITWETNAYLHYLVPVCIFIYGGAYILCSQHQTSPFHSHPNCAPAQELLASLLPWMGSACLESCKWDHTA